MDITDTFVNEALSRGQKNKLFSRLNAAKITNYQSDDDGNLIINQSIDRNNTNKKKILFLLENSIVNGYVNYEKNKLISLENSPKIINGGFNISDNLITSLEGGPDKVYFLYCKKNQLTSLIDLPEIVNQNENIENLKNKFDLDSIKQKIDRTAGRTSIILDISSNPLQDLVGCPYEIFGDFKCEYLKNLISYDGFPHIVYGNVWATNNITMKSLEHYPPTLIMKDFSTMESTRILFRNVNDIVKNNKEKFIPVLGNKIQFHKLLISLEPELFKYYKDWFPVENKKAKLLF